MKILVTGGAGFIGINSAKRFLDEGHEVIIFDNLSRDGTEKNLEWFKEQGEFIFIKGDVRDFEQVKGCFLEHRDIDVVLHLAAQVAVTTSVTDPRVDFEVNALGTFNVCEAVRGFQPRSILLNASTNKVYGEMKDLEIVEKDGRYNYKDLSQGIPETRPLDFHSPYGCSKGAADQYVMDYSRIYNLRTVNFRQSCIYGSHQFGVEDQGWVAWFAICAVLGRPVTVYGDGKQMRDILHIDDLVDCYFRAIRDIDKASGQVYNTGGGTENTLSLLELISMLERILGKKLEYGFDDWRPGDQKTFICDIRKARDSFGWKPRVDVKEGVERLVKWVSENRDIF